MDGPLLDQAPLWEGDELLPVSQPFRPPTPPRPTSVIHPPISRPSAVRFQPLPVTRTVEGGERSTPEQNPLVPPPLIACPRQLTSPRPMMPPCSQLHHQSVLEQPPDIESTIDSNNILEDEESAPIIDDEPTTSMQSTVVEIGEPKPMEQKEPDSVPLRRSQ